MTRKAIGGFMKKIVCDDYKELSSVAADFVARQLELSKSSVFGFPTGGTPVGMYKELRRRSAAGELDFSKAAAFNLDEYYPMKREHPQSYYSFMMENLFSEVKFASFDIPNGEANNVGEEITRYETAINAAGGIDLQILGIGVNGHIGFNEPGEYYTMSSTHTNLAESTINANSIYFSKDETQPTAALTMGIGSIFRAKKIILLSSGKSKAGITKKLLEDKIYPCIPASLFLLHNDFTLVMDKDAAGQ